MFNKQTKLVIHSEPQQNRAISSPRIGD